MKTGISRYTAVILKTVAALIICGLVCVPAFAQDETEVPTEPQNGIPLVIIRVDESEEAIAAAAAADEGHVYGTIDQMNESEDHSVRCVGTAEIKVPAEYKGEYGSVSVPAGEIRLDYIRGRGNTTWIMSKKPYKIQLSEKADLFGMGASKEWALMANKTDRTLLGNRITFWLGTQLGMKYTPQLIPVDLVMIGSEGTCTYLGSYCLSELVDVEESRVGIPKIGKDITASDADISGGYLLSIYNTFQDLDEPQSNWFTTQKSRIRLLNVTSSFDKEPLSEGRSDQRDYIRDYVDLLDELIMTDEDIIDEERHGQIAELLDLVSAADYWWLQEFSYNNDGFFIGSTYFYKERDGKLFFGPLWGF